MNGKQLIILDLDSTIICSLKPNEKQPKGLKGYNMDDQWIVYERPHLRKFLEYLFKHYNVGVWTAASKDYGQFIITNIIEKYGGKLKFYLFDHHEEMTRSNCIKDLKLVKMLFPEFGEPTIIDDNPQVYACQMNNSFPIKPFMADSPNATQDTSLLELIDKLKMREEDGTSILTINTMDLALEMVRKENDMSILKKIYRAVKA